MKKITTLVCALVCCGPLRLVGADSLTAERYRETLSHAPAAELPAKAAEMIKPSKSREMESTTVKVVRSAVEINPAAAPAIAGAVARAVPNVAAVAAATAAEQQPMQASAIARSAAGAAPSKAGKIVTAVCRVVPNRYRN